MGDTKPSRLPADLAMEGDGAFLEEVNSAPLGQSWAALTWPKSELLGRELGREIGRELLPK